MRRRDENPVVTRDTPLVGGVDLDDLAERTEGYVGADVEAICREASQIAVREYVQAVHDGDDPDLDDVVVTRDHFEETLETVEPTNADSAIAGGAQAAGLS